METRLLRSSDDRSGFRSGDPDLDRIDAPEEPARVSIPGPPPWTPRGRRVGARPGRRTRAAALRLDLAIRLADDYGCTGVLVDAKPDAFSFYEKLGFMALEVLEGQSDARPMPTAMFLPLAEIEAAPRR